MGDIFSILFWILWGLCCVTSIAAIIFRIKANKKKKRLLEILKNLSPEELAEFTERTGMTIEDVKKI